MCTHMHTMKEFHFCITVSVSLANKSKNHDLFLTLTTKIYWQTQVWRVIKWNVSVDKAQKSLEATTEQILTLFAQQFLNFSDD